ncbi:MAG: LytTR family DNA-binding domain-containing protein, partial [Bacteroidota bacterium]
AMPTTVFVTAFDQHALRAFEARALDYLLKPLDDERFEQALARARQQVSERREGTLSRRVSDALSAASGATPPPPEARFLADLGGRVTVIRARDIEWVEAAGDYVRLHTASGPHLLRETMASIDERLGGTPFVRIHRSTILHVDRIRELRPLANREYEIVLEGGAEVRLSRSYRQRLADAMGVDL